MQVTAVERSEAWGGVWPAAILVGASSAACLAAGVWSGVAFSAGSAVDFLPWVAEHALWGSALGALVTLALRLGSSRNPALSMAKRRRTVAVRATPAGVALGVALATGVLAGSPRIGLAAGLGAALAGAGWLAGLLLWLRARSISDVPRLDPAHVAALVAVLTLPLTIVPDHALSLLDAWRACMAP
jgi:hypothetical protein